MPNEMDPKPEPMPLEKPDIGIFFRAGGLVNVYISDDVSRFLLQHESPNKPVDELLLTIRDALFNCMRSVAGGKM